jgi:hypothetical protein
LNRKGLFLTVLGGGFGFVLTWIRFPYWDAGDLTRLQSSLIGGVMLAVSLGMRASLTSFAKSSATRFWLTWGAAGLVSGLAAAALGVLFVGFDFDLRSGLIGMAIMVGLSLSLGAQELLFFRNRQ